MRWLNKKMDIKENETMKEFDELRDAVENATYGIQCADPDKIMKAIDIAEKEVQNETQRLIEKLTRLTTRIGQKDIELHRLQSEKDFIHGQSAQLAIESMHRGTEYQKLQLEVEALKRWSQNNNCSSCKNESTKRCYNCSRGYQDKYEEDTK